MGRTPASFLLNQSSAEISSVHHRPPEATGVQEMIGGVPKGKTKSGQTADIPHSNPQVRKLEERTHRELAEPVDPKPLLYSRQLQAYTSIRALRVSRSVVNVQTGMQDSEYTLWLSDSSLCHQTNPIISSVCSHQRFSSNFPAKGLATSLK